MGYKEKNLVGGLLQGLGGGMMAQDKQRKVQAIAERKARIDELKAGRDDSGMSAGLKRTYDTAFKSNTTVGLDGSITRFDDMITAFEDDPKLSDEDRASLIALTRQQSKPIDENSDEWLNAAEKADNWISAEAGWTSSDKDDFAKYGGNREEARQAKTLEYYQKAGGITAAPVAKVAESSGQDSSGKYKSTDDVGAAYIAGKITKAEAEKLIRKMGST